MEVKSIFLLQKISLKFTAPDVTLLPEFWLSPDLFYFHHSVASLGKAAEPTIVIFIMFRNAKNQIITFLIAPSCCFNEKWHFGLYFLRWLLIKLA